MKRKHTRLLMALVFGLFAACEKTEQSEGQADLSAHAQEEARELASSSDASLVARRQPSIVLVHGAFADASGFQYLIPLLQRAGYQVAAVQNPLSSVADDVASTQRVLDLQPGNVVLVGHSYGGAVISAAANHPKVKALVYVAAFAPDEGEVLGVLAATVGEPEVNAALVPDSAGFLYIDSNQYPKLFAGDLFPSLSRVLAVSQRPVAAPIFGASIGHAAWHDLPSWYVVARQDRIIHPELERFMAKRMGAITSELDSSHVPFISQPLQVSRVVLEAARSVARQTP